MTTITGHTPGAPTGFRWGRIVLTAFLLEVALFVVLVPIGLWFGMPGAGNGNDYRVFFAAVPIGCLLFGYMFGRWAGRRIGSKHAVHGALIGGMAFLIYLAVCSIPPNTIALVIAGYGAPRFWLFNAFRLVGCVAGTVTARPRR